VSIKAPRPKGYVSAKGLGRLREQLSERDLAILEQICELRLMSAQQIEAVHFPVSEHDNPQAAARARQRVLRRLVKNGLLSPLARRVGGVRAGSAGFVFAPSALAHRLLRPERPPRREYEPTVRFVDHTLAAAQLVVDLTLAARQGTLDLIEAQAEPRCWREFSTIGGRQIVRPDAFVTVGVGDYIWSWFCEIDRGSESVPVVLRKCHLLAEYRQTGIEQTKHGGTFPRVCWLVPDELRAERLRRAIAADRHLPERLFTVATSEQAVAVLCGGTP
jgi:hypothetical protein